jgi:drug/metabolite transporter (DMT)-like permease
MLDGGIGVAERRLLGSGLLGSRLLGSRLSVVLPMLERLFDEAARLIVFVAWTHVTKRRTRAARMSAVTEPGRGGVVENAALLAIGLLGVSSSGPMMAAATGVPALAMSLWRTGLGAVVMTPGALFARRQELRSLTARDRNRSLVAGVFLAGHFATWVTSLHYTSVASATALVCLQVAWVVLVARLTGEPTPGLVVVGLVIALLGVLVVSGVDVTVSGRAVMGDALAIAGGAFASGYIIVGAQVRERTSTTTYTFVCYTSCATLLLAACAIGRVHVVGFDAKSWALIIGVTLAAQLLGHSVFNHLLAVMSPTVVSMALLLEVPGAAILAGVFLSQAPPVGAYVGVALICVGLAIVIRARGAAAIPREAPVD